MNWKYMSAIGVALVLGAGMLFLPAKEPDKLGHPEKMLKLILDSARYVSPDAINSWLMYDEPGFLLIDVRPASQAMSFAIPGSVHIPLDSLLSGTSMEILQQPGADKVFYSNETVLADQAWMVCKRLNMDRIWVLEGGLNGWSDLLLHAKDPGEAASAEDKDLYQFRLAARDFFFSGDEGKFQARPFKAPRRMIQVPLEKAHAKKEKSGH
jgi:rhodanese-related sulfurtransferase